jgi:hypothetical protein
MQIKYKVTGAKRKALAEAVSQELKTPAKYLATPTFSYRVGGYRIDKHGTLSGEDNLDLEDALHRQGFNAEEREYDEPDTYESGIGLDEDPDIDQHHPGQYANHDAPITEAMQRQLDEGRSLEMTEEEDLGLGRQRRDHRGEDGMRAGDVPDDILTIEMPLEGFTERALENLDKLIASKATLIKKAIGADALPVERTETTLKFSWFRFDASSEEVAAYTYFISALCATAKEQKRVTAQEKPVENEKWVMRVWLLRMGFIGDEYKTARKILLKNLSGNSAYSQGAPSKGEVAGE